MKYLGEKLSFGFFIGTWIFTYCVVCAPEAMAADASHMMSKGDVAIYLAMLGGACAFLIALIIRSSPKDDDQFNDPWGM